MQCEGSGLVYPRWKRIAPIGLLLCGVFVSATAVAAEPTEFLGDHPTGGPFRIRDLTFPGFLILGFTPQSAAPLGKGRWMADVHLSVVNDFQVSTEVETYLSQTRRPASDDASTRATLRRS